MNKRTVLKSLLGLGVLISVFLIGCNTNKNDTLAAETTNFQIISNERFNPDDRDDRLIVVKNIETGKKYMIYKGYQKGGIIPLDDK